MKFNLFILFFFFNIFLFTPRDCQVGATTQCVNPKGVAVDWWSILKLPVVPDAPNFSAQKLGVSYVYLDSTAPNAWQFDPSLELNGTANALSQTLAPVYASSSLGYLMYNDQDPATGTVHSSFGHTKGVWGFDSSTGFWLTHSVPRFPPSPYTYPDSETQYGQSFLCVSLTTTTINAAAQNLLFNKPYVFQSQLPDALAPLVPNITAVLAGKWVTGAPYTLTNVITTLAGTSWTTFAKNANWDNLLWSALVAPSLPSSLFVETWYDRSIFFFFFLNFFLFILLICNFFLIFFFFFFLKKLG